ncbi:unnamed protein product [Spirodela intermedia]|uniref:Uncharacterized protein n=1 Tax=Spirodela intermedia TaxID=51605 RepID=A0A7I8KRZ6_SPIIN|nr:unnamed protein product [Spirodela intermedia]
MTAPLISAVCCHWRERPPWGWGAGLNGGDSVMMQICVESPAGKIIISEEGSTDGIGIVRSKRKLSGMATDQQHLNFAGKQPPDAPRSLAQYNIQKGLNRIKDHALF